MKSNYVDISYIILYGTYFNEKTTNFEINIINLLLYHELQYNTIRYKNIITNLMAKLNCSYKICLLTKLVSYKLYNIYFWEKYQKEYHKKYAYDIIGVHRTLWYSQVRYNIFL